MWRLAVLMMIPFALCLVIPLAIIATILRIPLAEDHLADGDNIGWRHIIAIPFAPLFKGHDWIEHHIYNPMMDRAGWTYKKAPIDVTGGGRL
jgi:hypothetical protein